MNLMFPSLTATPTDGKTHGNLTDTFSNFHDYTVCIHQAWQVDLGC